MRWLSVFWATVMVIVTLSAVAAAEVRGFRGLKWGTELATLTSADFVRVPAFKGIAPDMESYRRQSDELTVAGMAVENINYNFRRGKLVSVNIDFRGYFVYERLMAFCKEQFGPPTGSMVKNMEYISSFESPGTGVLLYLQLTTPIYSDGRLFLYSRESFD
ncbi:MAG: hypothetical protein FD174_1227 [Geobacteraceae bacterium]|nr:MAG: hypothetical protein FD174_1227 [Geobacteraceae bacterium]